MRQGYKGSNDIGLVVIPELNTKAKNVAVHKDDTQATAVNAIFINQPPIPYRSLTGGPPGNPGGHVGGYGGDGC